MDFFKRTRALKQMVGDGNLSGIFAVDGGERTVPLEVGTWRTGPNAGVRMHNFTTPGTGPHAVQNSLEETYKTSLEDIAKTTLLTGPQEGMKRHLERVDREFKMRAPRVTGEYANSSARFVIDDGVPIDVEYGSHYGQDPSEAGSNS